MSEVYPEDAAFLYVEIVTAMYFALDEHARDQEMRMDMIRWRHLEDEEQEEAPPLAPGAPRDSRPLAPVVLPPCIAKAP